MSEEAETIKRLRAQGNGFVVSNTVADFIESLISQRDEAEQRGYRRGVEDALQHLRERGRPAAAEEISDFLEQISEPGEKK